MGSMGASAKAAYRRQEQERLQEIDVERLRFAKKIVMAVVDKINYEIIRPGPKPEERECSEFSIVACPFLNQLEARRRETNLPVGVVDAAGAGLKRQPGAVCLWITKSFKVIPAPGGSEILFQIGEPVETRWFREGRTATRDEIMESINTGLPLLQEMAEAEGVIAVRHLQRLVEKAMPLVPSTV